MALLFTLLLGVSAAILGYLLYDFSREDFIRETEAAIDAEMASILSGQPASQEQGAPIAYIASAIERRSEAEANVFFRLEDAAGVHLAGNLRTMPQQVESITEGIVCFMLESASGQKVTLAAKIHTFDDGTRLLVARDIHRLMASYERLQHLTALIMGLMLVVVLVSFGISYFVVSRINRIGALAQDIIATGDLSQRISIDSQWDDLSNLAQILNNLLARIESLLLGVREISNNIAHDLRTPLTIMRSDIEQLKHKPVTPLHIDRLLADADRILAIFQSLLRIANIEKGKRHQAFSEVRLGVVLRDVAELYEPLAEEKKIRLHNDAAETIRVKGDPDLLFQLFANLLDNAIKFSPPGGEVYMTLEKQGNQTLVRIVDEGPGIPDEEQSKVFNHFFRGDKSRNTEGNGLGLSLAKAVVELHGGQITLENRQKGLCITVMLKSYE